MKFKVLLKSKPKGCNQQGVSIDLDKADMLTIESLNDKQLGSIVRNPAFMAEYNNLITPTSAARYSRYEIKVLYPLSIRKADKNFLA